MPSRLSAALSRVIRVFVPVLLLAPLAAQLQFGEFGKGHLPVATDHTRAVVCCDVDGDGDLDLVLACGSVNVGEQNRLYLNDGDGTFTDVTASHMPVDSEESAAVVCCDVDGDGDPDLVFGNRGGGEQNRLYLNDGSGVFSDATAAQMPVDGEHTEDVACCDVDGDGDQDLVFANDDVFLNGPNRLYLNDGGGTFTDASNQMPGDSDRTFAVECCDVDGDGDRDLIFGSSGGQNRLYLNDGSGMFTDATVIRMPVDSDPTRDIACCDVDGDGDTDLVLGNYTDPNVLYRNNGNGVFSRAPFNIPNSNDTTFDVTCCDVDGDGDPDLVVGNYFDQSRMLINDGTGLFTNAPSARIPVTASDRTTSIACCDVDDDGDADLVLGNASQQDRLYLNDGGGNFTDTYSLRLPPDPVETRAVECCDVDGDGDADIILGKLGQNRVLLNDGSGTFTDATAALMPTGSLPTYDIACCDVDGDGDSDLVLANNGFQQNWLLLNDGSGAFTDVTAVRMPVDGDRTWSVACCDVDGDGDPDLVFGNYGQQNRLYLNDGSGTFTNATALALPLENDLTRAVACCDVDGDGDLDLIFGNTGQTRLLLNDGSGVFSDVTAARMPLGGDHTFGIACCDVDGDGDLDFVAGNRQQNRLYLNDGSGTFSDVTATHMPIDDDSADAVACCDLDGDGDPDIIVGNQGFGSGEQNRLYVNDGSGFFTDATAIRLPIDGDETRAVACCDLDGDGDPDLVIGNESVGLVSEDRIYINLQRQLNAPSLLRPGRAFRLDAYVRYGPAGPADVAVPFISCAPASIPLPPLGTVGLDPACLVSLPSFPVPQPAGVGSLSVVAPNIPGLVGLPIYAQVLLVQQPVPSRLTNVTADVFVDL